ncbi:MAG: protein kinase, partial [Chlamydiia bacterium]|nr:protein kinase [Chlamydiia bacterium]
MAEQLPTCGFSVESGSNQLLPDENIISVSSEGLEVKDKLGNLFTISVASNPFVSIDEARKEYLKDFQEGLNGRQIEIYRHDSGWIYLWHFVRSQLATSAEPLSLSLSGSSCSTALSGSSCSETVSIDPVPNIQCGVAPDGALQNEIIALNGFMESSTGEMNNRFTFFTEFEKCSNVTSLTNIRSNKFFKLWLENFNLFSSGIGDLSQINPKVMRVFHKENRHYTGVISLLVGHGAYKTFYLCPQRDSHERFCVVGFPRSKLPKSVTDAEIETEQEINQRLKALPEEKRSLFLIREYQRLDNQTVIFAPLCNRGTLDNDINLALHSKEKVRILSEITKGLSFLHEMGIVHGDIKPQNILLTQMPNQPIEVKVFDFGQSLERTERVGNWLKSLVIDVIPDATWSRKVGTPSYRSPEVTLGKKPRTISSDLFAFGVTAFEFLLSRDNWPVGFYSCEAKNRYGLDGLAERFFYSSTPFLEIRL